MPAMTLDRRNAAVAPTVAAGDATGIRIPRWFTLLSVLLLVVACAVMAAQWREPTLSRLQLEGRFDRLQPESVRQAASAQLSGGFFSVDIEAVRASVAQLPWAAKVRVERAWPAGLRIRVWEREPLARWNADGLLDSGAVAFMPASGDLTQQELDRLPRLGGTVGHEEEVLSAYRQLSGALDGTPLAITGVNLDARGEWTAQTVSGIELRLGQGEAAAQLPMLSDAVLHSLRDRLPEVQYVDLRYTNGFAIGWRKDNPEPATTATTTPVNAVTPAPAAAKGGARG